MNGLKKKPERNGDQESVWDQAEAKLGTQQGVTSLETLDGEEEKGARPRHPLCLK